MKEGLVFGIDLGTSNCCLAAYDSISNKGLHIIPLAGSPLVPSVIAITKDQQILVGLEAQKYGLENPDRMISSVKRFIGDTDWCWSIDNLSFSAIDLSSYILSYIKQEGENEIDQKIEEVVITVPAYFDEYRRRATWSSAERAGFKVLRLLNEPTAAALSYDSQQLSHSLKPKETQFWAIYDLGGGTFDISILKVYGPHKEVLATAGDASLGGDDFDQRLVCWMIDWLTKKYKVDFLSHSAIRQRLRFIAQKAKLQLSEDIEAKVFDYISLGSEEYLLDFTLTRSFFEKLIEDYIDYTLDKLGEVLHRAHLDVQDISQFILVGGPTRIPLVQEKLRQTFGSHTLSYIDPDLSVALGAAVSAAFEKGLDVEQTVVDVTPHSLGIAVWGELDQLIVERNLNPSSFNLSGPPLTFVPIIPKNSRLPSRFIKTFYTSIESQETIPLALYQGESYCTRENFLVGIYAVQIDPVPLKTPIHIGLEYDLNGMVIISVAIDKSLPKIFSINMQKNEEAISAQGIFNLLNCSSSYENRVKTNDLILNVEKCLQKNPNQEMEELLIQYSKLLALYRDDLLDPLEERLEKWFVETRFTADEGRIQYG